jgi:HSP20 family molecular chaperone IbpA
MANPETTTSHDLQLREKRELEGEGTRPGLVFRPDVDILERGDAYVVYADLPGADEQSVNVRLDRGKLSLDAGLATLPDPAWRPLHVEYRFGGYHREFQVSEEIDPDGVSASMRNGVLELRLRKAEKHRPRTIPIQAD